MPKIDDLIKSPKKTRKKPFKKSEYRPWNYLDEIKKETSETKNTDIQPKEEQVGTSNFIKKEQITDRDDKGVNLEQKKVVSIADVNLSNGEKSPSPEGENSFESIFRLTGHQKKIFFLIIEKCMARGTLTTGIINKEILAEVTNTTHKMVKTSIQRLVYKGLVCRERGKTGRGGFYSFSVSEAIRNAAIEYRRIASIGNQLGINKDTFSNQATKSIADSNENRDRKVLLPTEWRQINIQPLSSIGFASEHLEDIFEADLAEPEVVQESIYHFAYGLEYEAEKYKKYDDLLNVFIGRLRKGRNWREKNYRSPKEIAQAELLKQRKVEQERLKKLETEAYELAFDEWRASLTEEKENEIKVRKEGTTGVLPPNIKLGIYFKENIWKEIKGKYLVE